MRRGKIIWAVAGVALAWMAAVAFWFEPRSLTLTELDVATPSWPQNTAPLRVVLLSDLHIDDVHMTSARVRKIAARGDDRADPQSRPVRLGVEYDRHSDVGP